MPREHRRRPVRAPSGTGSLPRIVEEAIVVIETDGLDALSMRTLAARLGLSPMALYHHVPSRHALLDAVTDRLLDEVVSPRETTGDLRTRLSTIARSYVAMARKYPESFPLFAMRRFDSPRGFEFVEGVLGVLHDGGLSVRQAATAFRVIGYYLNGAALASIGVRELRRDARPSRLADFDDADAFPQLTAAAPHLGVAGLERSFELGLDAVLAFVEAGAGGRRAGPAAPSRRRGARSISR